jgi:hypothetical protein
MLEQTGFFVADGLHKTVYKVAHVLLSILGRPDDDGDILLPTSFKTCFSIT